MLIEDLLELKIGPDYFRYIRSSFRAKARALPQERIVTRCTYSRLTGKLVRDDFPVSGIATEFHWGRFAQLPLYVTSVQKPFSLAGARL